MGLPPTNQQLRYDMHAQKLEVFINGLQAIGLFGAYLVTDHILIDEDNNTMYFDVRLEARNEAGDLIALAKLDITTKRVSATYSHPIDSEGHINQWIIDLALGRY